jgi:hypothetical protein
VRIQRSVTRLDLSLANDVLVSSNDSRDPGVDQRFYLPEIGLDLRGGVKVDLAQLDGHGGSLLNKELRSVVVEAVQTHRAPADHRGPSNSILTPIITVISRRVGADLRVMHVDDGAIVFQVDEDAATALASARPSGLLIVPLVRSTR